MNMAVSKDSEDEQETSPLLTATSPNNETISPHSTSDHSEEFNSTQNSTAIADEVTTAQLVRIMSSTYLGIVLAALDGTMVATLTASISASYNSLTLLAWLAASYFIANAVLQPLAGKLTDIYGRRTGLVLSHVFFCAGNLICGLARGESTIILGRVFAGLGSGGLNGIPLFIASDLVPLRRRGIWQGINNIWFGLGSGLGGVFGGWINDTLGWRWAFILLVPLTVLSAILVAVFVRLPTKRFDETESDEKWKRIDFPGAIVLTSAIVILLVGLNAGGNTVPWFHPLVLVTIPLSSALFLVFVYVETSYAVEPIIPVKLLLNRTVIAACLTNWFFTMSQISLTFYAPVYFQVQGMSAMDAGIRLIPTSVGAAFGGIATGAMMRAVGKYYILNVVVQLLFLLPLGLTTRFSLDAPHWYPFVYFFFTGFAYAGMLTVTVTALIASVDQKDHAVITSGSFAFRGTGSTIGITICSLVFQNILITRLWESFGAEEDAEEIVRRLRDSLSGIKFLPHDWTDTAKDDYMAALQGVFLTIFGLAVLGTISSLFMKEHTLHKDMARRRS
ncbi:hypothetical protein N7G274_001821 [Stereocaulon virgatum]|uniref:Major facilitator superfamily (MFS) profile domain-containing protein n=1 Tax=Stereocaulon virgatum TaxID=373712 RepID=A0ABR4ALI5_9LECA